MIGYPIDYGNNPDSRNGFTSEVLAAEVNDYVDSVDEKCINNFKKGFTIGTLVFSATTMFTTVASASDVYDSLSGGPQTPPTGNDGSCPNPTPSMNVGGNVPTADRGAYAGAGITICTIALRTGSFWVGFVCAVALSVGMGMANTLPKN